MNKEQQTRKIHKIITKEVHRTINELPCWINENRNEMAIDLIDGLLTFFEGIDRICTKRGISLRD